LLDETWEDNVMIECACGAVIRGASERALLVAARRHIEADHHALGGPPADEDLLAMAVDELPGQAQLTPATDSLNRSSSDVES
jgi:hypothetical protein